MQAALTAIGRRNPVYDRESVDLEHADLTGADLQGADLSNSRLTREILTGANLQGAKPSGAIMPDGRVHEYEVTGKLQVPKSEFPASEVYGPTDSPVLVLITCGGTYEEGVGYSDNVIVYARAEG